MVKCYRRIIRICISFVEEYLRQDMKNKQNFIVRGGWEVFLSGLSLDSLGSKWKMRLGNNEWCGWV